MADNFPLTPGSGRFAATDQVTYSGDTADVQLMRPVLVTGAEGSRTVVDLPGDNTNGLDVDVTRVSGNVTIIQATASNLNAQVVGAGAAGAAVSGNPVLNAGSDGTNARTIKTDTAGSQFVVGDVADDAVDSGNPVKIGAYAEANPSTSVIVADADRVNIHADTDGILFTKPFTSYGDILVERVTNTDGASTALTTFGATAGTRNFITMISLYNSSTTNGFVDIRDGTAGTVLLTLPLPANGGSILNLTLPLRQTTANTALAFDVSAALTTVYLSFIGFKSKV